MKTLLLLPFLLTTVLFAQMRERPTVEQLFSVQTIKVQKQKVSHTKKNYGYVVADGSRIYDISPRFGGYVEKLYADKIYMYVKKGQPLVTLYSPEVYKAKEDYLNSYNYTKGRTSKGMLRSAKRKLELLGIDAKEIADVLKKQRPSRTTTIYAPVSGYIFAKNIVKGAAFNAKSKLFEIVDLDSVWVEAKIFEEDVLWIKNADDFELHFKTTPKIYKTKTKYLYPSLNPKEATLTMRLTLKNKDHTLFLGMYANVISKDKAQTYLTLPRSAVIRKDNKYYAFMVGEYEGEYEPIEVHVKPLDNKTYIVLDGLGEGDEVVNNALFMMDSDAQINGLY